MSDAQTPDTASLAFLLGITWFLDTHRTIILPVVLYGCETWSLTSREEHRLRVFQNRVLRRVFGRKRDEVTGEWRNLHSEELNKLYTSPNIVMEKNEMDRACSAYRGGERRIQGFGGET